MDNWVIAHYTQKQVLKNERAREIRNNVLLGLLFLACLTVSGLAEHFFINL